MSLFWKLLNKRLIEPLLLYFLAPYFAYQIHQTIKALTNPHQGLFTNEWGL